MAAPADRLDDLLSLAAASGRPVWEVGEVIEGIGIEVV
jgi:hypothetical protein